MCYEKSWFFFEAQLLYKVSLHITNWWRFFLFLCLFFLESFNKYVFVRPYCNWQCSGTGSAVHAEFMNQNRNNNIYRKIKCVLCTSWMVLGAMFQLSMVKNKNIWIPESVWLQGKLAEAYAFTARQDISEITHAKLLCCCVLVISAAFRQRPALTWGQPNSLSSYWTQEMVKHGEECAAGIEVASVTWTMCVCVSERHVTSPTGIWTLQMNPDQLSVLQRERFGSRDLPAAVWHMYMCECLFCARSHKYMRKKTIYISNDKSLGTWTAANLVCVCVYVLQKKDEVTVRCISERSGGFHPGNLWFFIHYLFVYLMWVKNGKKRWNKGTVVNDWIATGLSHD